MVWLAGATFVVDETFVANVDALGDMMQVNLTMILARWKRRLIRESNCVQADEGGKRGKCLARTIALLAGARMGRGGHRKRAYVHCPTGPIASVH
jgi:hypothetical protein